jgi:Ni/Co efflux regulator RcnB
VKKLIIAALAASAVVATPVLAAPYQHQKNDGRGRVEQRNDHRNEYRSHRNEQRQVQNRRWNKGERFDRQHARNYRVISNARQYNLRDAPRGYRWVQSGNDAVLIGITSGIIATVLASVLR